MNWIIKLARFTLYLMAVGFVVNGAILLVSPDMNTTLFDIGVPTTTARVEVRGLGGLGMGTGLLFFMLARRPDWLRPAMLVLAAMMGGLVVGRTVGIIVDGPPNFFEYSQLATEAFGLAVALLTLWHLDRTNRQRKNNLS